MKNVFETQLIAISAKTRARVTKVTTPHGEFLTPTFMPVGTRAFVNYLTPEDLRKTGSHIILGGNTYHMLVSPGLEVIESLGGMHKMMNWSGPMLTDSGGYQLFSLSQQSDMCKINEEGARFKHPVTGQRILLTPETSLEAQRIIGADIMMAFDQCTPDSEDKQLVQKIMERTHRWLLQSKTFHEKNKNSAYGFYQALFGIIQGSYFQDLREESAKFSIALDLDGYAVGGETIGYDMKKTVEIIRWIEPLLPKNKIRYSMGVGLSPQDLIDVVAEGIDIFDCVAPTRNARHGSLYHGRMVEKDNWFYFESEFEHARLQIKRSIYAKDDNPILERCGCHTCQHYSRGYLHYLLKTKSLAFSHLACIHNIHVMQKVCEGMRGKITTSSS